MLSKQTILEHTNSGFAVFRHYISFSWQLGKKFYNPLYADKNASCNIYFDRKSRTYRLKDFGNDTYSGDCFAFVGHLKKLDCKNSSDFVKILKIINQDLSLGLEVETPEKKKTSLNEEKHCPEKKRKTLSIQGTTISFKRIVILG